MPGPDEGPARGDLALRKALDDVPREVEIDRLPPFLRSLLDQARGEHRLSRPCGRIDDEKRQRRGNARHPVGQSLRVLTNVLKHRAPCRRPVAHDRVPALNEVAEDVVADLRIVPVRPFRDVGAEFAQPVAFEDVFGRECKARAQSGRTGAPADGQRARRTGAPRGAS